MPARNVVLLQGDGGTGKSLLAMQLAVACATATDWIGIKVQSGPVLYFSAEEDRNETHIRLAEISAAEGVDLSEAHTLELAFLAGEDAVLAYEGKGVRLLKTPLLKRLVATLEERHDTYMQGNPLPSPLTDQDGQVPSADALAAELEKFLATRRVDGEGDDRS